MKEQVIAEVKIIPLGTETASLSRYVAACIDIVKRAQGIEYRITAMGTIIQGPLRRVLEITEQMHQVPFTLGAKRVLTSVSIDDRRDKPITIDGKVKAVA